MSRDIRSFFTKAKPSVKKPVVENKSDFDNEEDAFDATLIQLDTSQVEDEYLATVNKKKSPSSKNKGKSDSNSKKVDKDVAKVEHKNGIEKKKHTEGSKSKNEKSSQNLEKNKEKNKKDHHPKLEIEQTSKSHEKTKEKSKRHHEKSEAEKTSKSHKHNEEVDLNGIIEEKIEKKKQHAVMYQNYLNRGGARNPGSKEIPQGREQCLLNVTFLITGVLDSLEREEVEGIIKQYGGRIIHSVSKKVDYIIVGSEPGPSKMAKAESLGIKKLSEDDFLDLLRTLPAKVESKNHSTSTDNKRKRDKSASDDQETSKKVKRIEKEESKKSSNGPKESSPHKGKNESPLKAREKRKSDSDDKIKSPEKKRAIEDFSAVPKVKVEQSQENEKKTIVPPMSHVTNLSNDGVDHITALVEKYRPKELKQIIGQNGDKSNAKKLHFWLSNWYKNHGKDSKITKPKFNARDDTGTIYKAALLSGPPGIGKTTTAYVVCAQLEYEILEFNASDTRSKKLLQEQIAGILSNNTMKSFLDKSTDKKKAQPKHVLLMDEVDGMAGNEDRGGMQELIAFIKATEVPIICICNDRMSQKIKTLANYTFDLRFQKPRLEQIRAAMMSVCFKEGVKVTPKELDLIIQSTNQDIRQVINHIAVLSAKSQTEKESTEKTKFKNLRLGPWDVVRKVFSTEEHKNMSIHDKSDLFFHDYNIAPLFVEENYLMVTPSGPRNEVLSKVAKCSESLAIGDTVEKVIRSSQGWSLLPVQACFSSVIPGTVMSGFINSQISFPSWLGKNSRKNKCDRLLQDITVHARLATGASKEAINLDYLKMLVDSIVRPLAVEGMDGVDKAVEVMIKYHLSREDLDSLIELTKWPHTRDPMQSVESKVKAAFTKAYNKNATFSSAGTMKKKSSRDTQPDEFIGSDEEQLSDDDEDDDTVEKDKLIKAKTSKAKSAPSESKSKGKRTANTKSKAKNK